MLGRICLILCSLVLASCHDHTDDCIDWDGPVFQTDALPDAVLNQEYSAEIQVQIEHEPFDDAYFYHFDYRWWDLPQGLTYRQFDHSRVLEIEGTPTESGVFKLDIEVSVSGNPDLCYYRNYESYTLVVNEL